MVEPPFGVGVDVAAPFGVVDLFDCAFEGREVVPVVAMAGHDARVGVVVILLAVGREVDGAHLGLAWGNLVVAREALPQVGAAGCAQVDLLHDRFDTMPEGVQHLAHAALVRKAHDHKAPRAACGVGDGV